MAKIYLDFDGKYNNSVPSEDIIVLTNAYNEQWAVNVKKETFCREDAYLKFEQYMNSVEKDYSINMNINKSFMFDSFFFPVAQWISAIDKIRKEDQISEVIFSSYSNNSKIFMLEAESESNGQFLYRKSYFLSYYINLYLKQVGITNIHYEKIYSSKAAFSFFLRGMIFLHVKFFQLLFYKLFIWKRFYGKEELTNHALAIASRGIVQSQFIEGLYKSYRERIFIFINESSSKPFRNLKFAKKNFATFFFSEGNISMLDLLREYILVIGNYLRKKAPKKIESAFYGIRVNLSDFLPELGIKEFHMKTFACSFVRSMTKVEKQLSISFFKIISLDMLPPFSHHIRVRRNHIPVVQIQTTLMEAFVYPDFVYSDKFYFSNSEAYNQHYQINHHFSGKFDVLNNVKYLAISKQPKRNEIRKMTYFAQPVYIEEEIVLVKYLHTFCMEHDIDLQIKLHPRSNSKQFNTFTIPLIDGTVNSQDIISQSDVVVTRNSSIGLDSWFANVPVVFFVNGTLKGENIDYIPQNYLGAIKSNVPINEFEKLFEDIISDFYSHPLHKKLYIDKGSIYNALFNI